MAFKVPFDLPPDVAIAQARAQNVVHPVEFLKMTATKRAQAFTASNLAKLDQIQAIADALAKSQANGETFADFQKWAKAQDFGLPKHRLETIYRNAVQQSYNAGHWREFEENANDRPYLMYDAINDSRVRPSHLALDGVIRPVGDAYWKTHSPSLGHRCRCRLVSLSREEAMRRGGMTQNTPAEGGPDAGWGANPMEWGEVLGNLYADKLAKAHPSIVQALESTALPKTPGDFMRLGRAVTDTLPDGISDPAGCHRALLELLEKEVGISKPCAVNSTGAGAQLVASASKRYPNSWTKEADNFGPLYTKAMANTRGSQRTLTVPPSNGGTHYKTPDFGVVKYEKNMGQIVVRTGDVGNAVHEYAHRLQAALPGLDGLFQELHRQRTSNDAVKRLNDIVPGRLYKDNELTREDHYTNPYQGREYLANRDLASGKLVAKEGGALEVMSMGLENVLGVFSGHWRSKDSLARFQSMYQNDRDMFDFVVGVLRHWKP